MRNRILIMSLAIVTSIAGFAFGHFNRSNGTDPAAQQNQSSETNPLEPQASITPQTPFPASPAPARPSVRPSSYLTVPAGTAIAVSVDDAISSKTAYEGQPWSGVVTEAVIVGDRVVIPAGSPVHGTVRTVIAAERGSRATLQLGLSSVNVRGRSYSMGGTAAQLTAGSPRTRNVAAIAGGTAAGALIGRAVSHSTKGTVIGAVVGGAATTGAVAATKGYQVSIKEGQDMTFTTSRSLAVARA